MTEDHGRFLHLGAHESVLEVMQKYMLAGKEGIPAALVVDAKGEGHPMVALFRGPGDKEAFSAQIKAEVAARKAICAAFAAECWLAVVPPGTDVADVSPSRVTGRLEVIAVHSEGRDGTILDSLIEVVRDAHGKVTGFEKLAKERRERGDTPATQGEGRFTGFFSADA